MGLFAEDMRVSFFHQRVCVRSKDAAHLLSLLSLPPPACLRSSAAANRPPPSLRSTPLFLLLSLPFSIAKITSHSHSRAVYISSLSPCGSSCSAPPVNSPSSSSASLVNFIRASVHYASLCLLSLSLFRFFFYLELREERGRARFSSQGEFIRIYNLP